MRVQRFFRALLAASAAAVVAAGCGGDDDPSSDGAAKEGAPVSKEAGEITIAIAANLPPLDPHQYSNHYLETVVSNIYESMLGFGSDVAREMTPELAAELPERIDETTWRFKVREGVTFTNGEPLNADAVVFSVKRIIDPEFASERDSEIETIKTAKAVDDMTVDVITKSPDALLPNRMTTIKIAPPEYFEADEETAIAEPVGTGPYKWVSGSDSGPIELERNADYWGEPAKIEKATVRVISEVTTSLAALQAGEIDLMTQLPPDATEGVPKVFEAPGIQTNIVGYNTRKGITSDVRVRRALSMAIDREALANDLFAGFATVTNCQVVQPDVIGYNEDLEATPYDPEQAKALIEEAGATGKPITLVGGRFFPKGSEAVQAIAAYWTAVGLDVELDVHAETPAYAEAYFSKFDRPEAVYVESSERLADGAGAARSLHSDGLASAYGDPEVDRLFAVSLETTEEAEREAALNEVFATACEEAVIADLNIPDALYAGTEQVEWTPRSYDAEELDIARMSITGG